VVNGEDDRVRELLAALEDPVVVLDSERRLVGASPSAAVALGDGSPGRRVSEEDALAAEPRPLVLFRAALPALSAYQELRAGFTAAVSHELRTPLTRLLVLLENTTLPGADVEELVEQARQEILQTRELIDDVLFLGELETGREVVSLGRTEALPILEEVVESLADRALHAGVTVTVGGNGAVDLPLRPRMIRVVAENLVQNAIRYAGHGSACRISLERDGSSDVLVVADDGMGVPENELPRLFERFYRADQARTSRGTGLGLAIVKHILNRHRGRLIIRSELGKGSTFTIKVPIAET
jgi:two-component system, OmpR family, phosphate regulon sensor histidine kinase PhoR